MAYDHCHGNVPYGAILTKNNQSESLDLPRHNRGELRGVTFVDQFRKHLKTYLFKLAYDV